MLISTKNARHDDGTAPTSMRSPASPFVAALATFMFLYAAIAAPHVLSIEPATGYTTAVLALFLVSLSAWDIITFRLPDALTFSLIAVGVAVAPTELVDWRAMSAAIGGGVLLTFALVYRRFRGRDGMGFGDVKLFAAAGAWVGLESLSSVLLIACVAAIIAVWAHTLIKAPIQSTDRIAFGPFLALGLWVVWMYGPIGLLAI